MYVEADKLPLQSLYLLCLPLIVVYVIRSSHYVFIIYYHPFRVNIDHKSSAFPTQCLQHHQESSSSQQHGPLLYDQYEFHSIKCIKTRYGHQSFVIRWRKPISTSGFTQGKPEKPIVVWEGELVEDEESVGPLDGLNEPQVQDDNGDCFLLTDECIGLVQSAFPDETEHFLQEKKLRELKKKNVSEEAASSRSTTMGAQTSITDFYCSTKAAAAAQSIDTGESSIASVSAEKKRQATSSTSSSFSKSVRRRLLFG